MSHVLDGCLAKIARADEHINNLAPELDAFVTAHYKSYRATENFDLETGKYIITGFDDGVPDHPARFAVIIGEIIAHLRSSLDYVVWALATARRPNLSDKIGFPICETADGFAKALKNQMLRGVPQRCVGLIDSVQPYRQKLPRRSPLFRLHLLNNADKHRLLLVTGGAMANPNLEIDPGGTDVTVILPDAKTVGPKRVKKDGTEVVSVTITGHNPNTKINGNISCQVAFEDIDARFSYVIPGLKEFRNATAETIELFRGEL